jgi:hypothetical protein
MAGELAYKPGTGELVFSPATGQLALSCGDGSPSGDGDCFQMGTSGSFVADRTGTLRLICNDNNYSDNSGSWSITITPGGTYTLYGATGSVNGPAVSYGQTYNYTASGIIEIGSPGDCPQDPDGNGDCVFGSGPADSNYPCQGLERYSLVGKVYE